MKTSPAGIDLIKQFEGCRLEPYQDSAGVWTVGYGHTRGVKATDSPCTESQAEMWLIDDLQEAERAVSKVVKSALTQSQFDALVSFTFNLGAVSLSRSTLLWKLNRDYPKEEIAEEFGKWVYANHEVLPGLVRRRLAERELFLS